MRKNIHGKDYHIVIQNIVLSPHLLKTNLKPISSEKKYFSLVTNCKLKMSHIRIKLREVEVHGELKRTHLNNFHI